MVVSLCLTFEVLAVVICLHALYGIRIHSFLRTSIFVLLEVIWIRIIRGLEIDAMYTMLMYVGVVIYCGIQFGWKVKEIIVNNVLCIFIISIIQASFMILLFSLGGISSIEQNVILLINVATFTSVFLLSIKCNFSKISKVFQEEEKIIIAVLIAIIASMLFFVTNYRYSKGINVVYYAVLIFSVILLIAILIDIGKHKMKANKMEAELRLHKLYEQSFQNLIDDIRARQHEFDNHINTIYSQHYLYNTYDTLVEAQKKYCNNIVYSNKYNKLLTKGNPIILGFLYSKFAEAEKRGIDIEYKVKIDDLKCDVPIYKMVELLGNLITNAIEALTKQKDLNKLRVVILEQPYEIAVDISNECKDIDYNKVQRFFTKGYSEKGENRGYGLYNVKKICEEYNIVLETVIKQENAVNCLHFVLIINKPL